MIGWDVTVRSLRDVVDLVGLGLQRIDDLVGTNSWRRM